MLLSKTELAVLSASLNDQFCMYDLYMSVCGCTVLWHCHGGKWATCGSQFSCFALWFPGGIWVVSLGDKDKLH